MDTVDLIASLPIITLSAGSLLLLLVGLLFPRVSSGVRLWFALTSCGVSWICSWTMYDLEEVAFSGMLFADPFALAFNSIILGGTILTFLFNDRQLRAQRVRPSVDVDVLILLTALGAMVMASAAHFIALFIGFELLSVAVYVLTGLARDERASAEGALKYFVLGAFSSAFLLYGMALVYGATGSLGLAEIGEQFLEASPMLLIGIGLLIFGFGFKISLVPFHFWTPDAYQGAPVSIAGFMATVVKAAAFAAFLRLLQTAFADVSDVWIPLIWVLSVLTMTYGNLVALRQKSVKRMLAYSSIAHAGYALIGLLALDTGGGDALVFYLFVYAIMTLAAFGVVLVATAGSDAQYEADDVQSLSGLGWSHPLLGLVMAVSMLSLAGMPPLAGFIGKFYLFSAAVQAGFVGLAIIAALNSVVSLYYYLNVIVVMYFQGERKLSWAPPEKILLGSRAALVVATVGTIYFGLFSGKYLEFATRAFESL